MYMGFSVVGDGCGIKYENYIIYMSIILARI